MVLLHQAIALATKKGPYFRVRNVAHFEQDVTFWNVQNIIHSFTLMYINNSQYLIVNVRIFNPHFFMLLVVTILASDYMLTFLANFRCANYVITCNTWNLKPIRFGCVFVKIVNLMNVRRQKVYEIITCKQMKGINRQKINRTI